MNSPQLRWTLAGLALLLMVGWFWWAARGNPENSFLPTDAAKPWWIYPAPPDTEMHPASALTATYTTEFIATETNRAQGLQLRAYRSASLRLNNQPLTPQQSAAHWKQEVSFDLRPALRLGTNQLSITVTNDFGPPALSADWDHSDPAPPPPLRWRVALAGASEQPAVAADAPRAIRPGNKLYGAETAASAGWLGSIYLLIGSGVILAGAWGWARLGPKLKAATWLNTPRGQHQQTWWPLLLIAGVWLVYFTNNLPQLPSQFGFDTDGHTEYIRYIQEKGRLPLANEGWQMYQPPLYYLLSAGWLEIWGLTTNDAAATHALRALSGLIGLLNVTMVFLSLRRCFPQERWLVVIGTAFAGFLPAQFYIAHYITNEGLAAALATTCLYFTIRLRQTEAAPNWLASAVGGSLGLALLAKFSTVLLIPFVALAVLPKKNINPSPMTNAVWRQPLIAALTALACCGWHYGRVWLHFGSPLIGNWSAASGFHWWQENGYVTANYFLPSGHSLGAPLFAGFHHFFDGLYSTLWGDGLCGGGARIGFRPPWNYDLMITAGWLALLPSLLLLVGALRCGQRWIREGKLAEALWPGILIAFLFATAAMTLRVPSYAQAKSVYALAALLPLTMCLIEGLRSLAGQARWRQRLLGGGMLLWMLTALGSFWIVRNSAATLTLRAATERDYNRFETALRLADQALRIAPGDAAAALQRSAALQGLGQLSEARQQLEAILAQQPSRAEALLQLAQLCAQAGEVTNAVRYAEQATAAAPDFAQAWHNATVWAAQLGEADRTITLAREALRLRYSEGGLHYLLGNALIQKNELAEGIAQLRSAVALKPDWAPGWSDLAWNLATASDPNLRNGAEAVTTAEQACALTQNQVPKFIGTLAAAYAETGRFAEAIATAERARDLARAMGQEEIAQRNEQLLLLYRSDRAYHAPETTP